MGPKEKVQNFRTRKVVWVGFLQGLFLTAYIQILRHLAKRGHEVSLVTVHSKKKTPFQRELSDIRLISIPLRYLPFISLAAYIVVLLLVLPFLVLYLKPDFVVVSEDGTALGLCSTLLLPRSVRPKIVLDIRSTPVDIHGLRGSLTDLFFNTSVRMASKLFDGMTIVTRSMKREICDKFRINPESFGVWTNGVPTDLFDPRKHAAKATELRRTTGLDGKFVIIYHGAFSHERGIIETVHSISLLRDKCPDVVLFLLGIGQVGERTRGSRATLSELNSLVKKERLQDRVLIHEPVNYEDVPAYIMMCDVGIVPLPDIPDWRNQSALKLLEYLAMEKTVIATDIPSNREVIGNSKCGIYASSSEPKEIGRAILYAIANREKISEWGRYGRRIAEEKYSYDKVAGDLEGYLLSLGDYSNGKCNRPPLI